MRIAIVGPHGLVGQELQTLFTGQTEHKIVLLDSRSEPSFRGIDLAFFCTPAERARALIPLAVAAGAVCIDSSTAYRHDPTVPLVIPEINGKELEKHQGVIASPNCTTTLMLLPLAPIHRTYGIKRIIATTYQAISGAGKQAIEEFENSSLAYLEKREQIQKHFPAPCAFNVFPHESPMQSNGYVEEEEKMETETRKILQDPHIGVSATCIRVPVFRSHSVSVNVLCKTPPTLDHITHLISNAPGVVYHPAPNSIDAEKKVVILCGRIRLDRTNVHAVEMWICGDQLLKGAALNMKQIADHLCLHSMI